MDRLRSLFLSAAAAAVLAAAAPALAQEPEMTVFKSPWCGCCGAWVDHAREAGFAVTVKELEDLEPIKAMAGIPEQALSCHTTLVGDYVVEGHVPADLIRRLLNERPDIDGIAAPGMPVGSPGMEGPGAAPYTVVTFDDGALVAPFATVTP